MNKQTRAARAAEAAQVQEAALEQEIERAAAPLLVSAQAVERFDAAVPETALAPLPSRRAAALLRSLHRALDAAQDASPLVDAAATFGDLLRQGRERARLDVADVARRLHVHRDYLAGIEAGARSPLALGADGARRAVTLLGIPPGAAAAALQASMLTALTPTASFSARMKRGVPRETRRRILEDALPTTPDEPHLQEWHTLIAAVRGLGPNERSE